MKNRRAGENEDFGGLARRGYGEHTDEILEELGVTAENRAALRTKGILG